jgi:signal peptidase I
MADPEHEWGGEVSYPAPDAGRFARYCLKRLASLLATTVLLVLLLLRFLAVQPCFVPTDSMAPTIRSGDHLLINTWVSRVHPPQRGDIVVCEAPPEAPPGEQFLIKRLIGLPGDRIQVWEGFLYRNGLPVPEKYVAGPMAYDFPGGNAVFTVPPEEVFLLGDNRNRSSDSRVWGSVPRASLMGRAFCLYWPRERMRVLH